MTDELRAAARSVHKLTKLERRAILQRALVAISEAQKGATVPLSPAHRAAVEDIRFVTSSSSTAADLLVAEAMNIAAKVLDELAE